MVRLSRPLLIILTMLLAGCAGRSIIGPRNPLTQSHASGIGTHIVDNEQLRYWRWAYQWHEGSSFERVKDVHGQRVEVNFVGSPNPDAAKLYRNKILKQLLVIDDEFFTLWSQKMYGTRAIGSGLADLADGIMGAFVTASGASSAKSLGLAITGVSTARLSAQKNIFMEQSVGALISTMEEDRNKVRAQMLQYMRDQSVYDYSLEDGLSDVLRYYKAGTLASAASSLQATAAIRERQSSAVAEALKGDDAIAKQELERAKVEEFVIPPKANRPTVSPNTPFDSGPPKKGGQNSAANSQGNNGQTTPKSERPVSDAAMDHGPTGADPTITAEEQRLINAIRADIKSPNVNARELKELAEKLAFAQLTLSENPAETELVTARAAVAERVNSNSADQLKLEEVAKAAKTAAAENNAD